MNDVPVEPHADIREGAATAYQMYVAFQEAGFSPHQALELLKANIMAAGQRK